MLITILILCAVAYGLYALLRKPKTTNQSNTAEPKPLIKSENYYFNTLELKGAAFNICKQLDVWEGTFEGYLKITYNQHDKYAIGVYRSDNTLIGWLPKNSKNIYDYLKYSKIKKIPCWGYFTYQQYRENWVSFFTNITNLEAYEISCFLWKKHSILYNLENTKNYQNIFISLNNIKELESIMTKINHFKELKFDLPHNYIASLSKELEKQENWGLLIKLEDYKDYFSEKTIFQRIEKAKLKL